MSIDVIFILPHIFITYSYFISGFHLSATVTLSMPRSQFNVAVTFDRQRISSCNCTCSSLAHWCSHIVAVCLYRIHLVSIIQVRLRKYRCNRCSTVLSMKIKVLIQCFLPTHDSWTQDMNSMGLVHKLSNSLCR